MTTKKEQLKKAEDMLAWHDHMQLKPIPLYGKDPFIADFGNKELKPADFLDNNGEMLNRGWLLGYGNLCDIDIDTTYSQLIFAADDIFADINPFTFGKSEFIPSHIMCRTENRPIEHTTSRIIITVPDRKYKKPDGKIKDSEYDIRLGGYGQPDHNGNRPRHQVQTFVWGIHPATGEPLYWQKKLHNPEDIPTIEWGDYILRINRLIAETGAKIISGTFANTLTYQPKRTATPPQIINLKTLQQYITKGATIRTCPFCGDNSFTTHPHHNHHIGKCHHDQQCASKTLAANGDGAINTYHLLGWFLNINYYEAKKWCELVEKNKLTPADLFNLPQQLHQYADIYGTSSWHLLKETMT